ncbi:MULTISPECIES: GvpL/GvpF family gas vesicle protein [unclassified Streptomyces]|uniref:GvpL/GvpF family gas vesicle protein n=1 Tax=Streptomyces TaxID=1883 RepID=UPI0001C1B1A2|nr:MULTISPECIES: GvpL/GvpF family gas vesicle protein [unclassified Streptomyces]MYR66789.1 gas vesicle protein [Streptomyces sp. SID4939]MYS03592.1 gas vesicle protein [Streptomyces sp. SID4940]MYT66003.1 gas vesicle protein [Streptomyces sp. SID8357]MYT88921.1 gas vesicle protein [Streptomyces sp. SID8360]MYU37465.1 gas vesicle protein [Streptomyces sp. SID8358]MYW41632.1 gas vesicle protein [Streptomyces sp. SID1]
MAAGGVYVYAIIPSGRPLPSEAVGVGAPPAPLRLLSEGPVAAVVSEAPPQLRAKRRDLMAHQELLVRLTDTRPVLPMRFGVVAPDEETVRGELTGARKSHLAALRHLSDGVEINLKALPSQDALAAVVAEEKQVRRLRDEVRRRPGYEANVRLGEAVAAALARRAAEAGQKILHALTPLAREVVPGPEVQGCALNVSFLVDRHAGDHFRTEAQKLADSHRGHVELRIAGPLPCYSFVTPKRVRTPAAGA